MASKYGEFNDSLPYLFTYDPIMDFWIQSTFPKEFDFAEKSNWSLVPILGEVHLFTANKLGKYNTETEIWTKIDHSIDFLIEDIAFQRIAFD